MLIQIPTFNGVTFKYNAEALPPTAAQDAVDCNFTSGALSGLRDNHVLPDISTVPSGQSVKSGFSIGIDTGTGTAWQAYAWPYDTNAVRSPVQNDKYHRFYWTGRKADGSTEFKFALPTKSGESFVYGTYGEPVPSYKVGVINTGTWDYDLESIYIQLNKANVSFRLPTNNSAQLVKFYVVGKDGKIENGVELINDKDCYFSADSSYPKVNGNDLHWNLTVVGGLAASSQKVIGTTTYKSYAAKVEVENSNWANVDARIWYTGDNPQDVKFITIIGNANDYPVVYDAPTYTEGVG